MICRVIDRRTLFADVAGASTLALVGCGSEGPSPSPAPSPTRTGPVVPRVAGTIATGLNVPWGVAFLTDGRALVGQRDRGVIVMIDPKAKEDNRVTEIGAI